MLKKFLLLLCFSVVVYANSYNLSQDIKNDSQKNSLSTQVKINSLDDKTKKMYEEYKKYLSLSQTQSRYNKQLRELIVSQDNEMAILLSDIQKIEHTHKNIIPLMQKMISNLDAFIKLDTPFLLKEREARVKKLKENMKRADVSVSDKYRQILEAYMIENDYAKNIESYKDKVDEKVVELLRIGRVALYYQTLDFKNSGMWDKKKKKFISLDSSYNKKILQAIKISKRQITPDLLILPMIRGGE